MLGKIRPSRRTAFRAAAISAFSLMAGCASYTALPLAKAPRLAGDVRALTNSETIVGASPLSVSQVVDLALANNRDLKAARFKRAVAAGQTKQAGILPNPSLSGAFLPLLSGAGSVPAWNIGLSQDIKSLIT